MKTLKSMREFCLANSDKNSIEYKEAVFQSQQPNIGMFVPAVCNNGVWRVLEEPTVDAYMQPKEMDKQYAPYQQAKSKVIFEGWDLNCQISDLTILINNSIGQLWFHKDGQVTLNALKIHTLEDLVKFNLEMI